MSVWEDMARAVANSTGFSPQSFSGPGYETVWAQLKPWLGRITTNSVLKWIPRAASQLPCQIPHYENGFPVGPCSNHALDTCLTCGSPVCLEHSFIEGQRGDAVCYLCVAKMRAAGEPDPQQQQQQQQQQKPDKRSAAEAKAWWARGVLFVAEGVPWETVKTQHRKLSAQHHPDRGGDDKKFKQVQEALEILKIVYGEN